MPEQSTTTPSPEAPEREGPERRDDLPVPRKRTRDREVWVGLFVVLGVTLTLVALYTLTDAAFFRGRYIISTFVPDAGGIRRGDPVQMLGVNVGRVHRFSFGERGVEIRLELEGEYPVPADSRVELTSSSLLGGMVAEIHPGQSKETIKGGAVLPGSTQEGLMEVATDIAGSTETVLGRLETALSEETIRSVSRTAQSVEKGSAEAKQLLSELRSLTAEQRKELVGLTQSLRRSAVEIEEASARPELDQAITRLDTLTKNLESSTASLGRSSDSLEAVLARLERGEGSLGRLTKDDALYVNLNEATVNLNRLLVDVRRNPKRYVDLSIF